MSHAALRVIEGGPATVPLADYDQLHQDLEAMAGELAASRHALTAAHRRAQRLSTELADLKQRQAEDDCDASEVKDLIVFHYGVFGRTRAKKSIQLTGSDGVGVRYLLRCELLPRDIALGSVGFRHWVESNPFYDRRYIGVAYFAGVKVNGKRLWDEQRVLSFAEDAKRLRGEA